MCVEYPCTIPASIIPALSPGLRMGERPAEALAAGTGMSRYPLNSEDPGSSRVAKDWMGDPAGSRWVPLSHSEGCCWEELEGGSLKHRAQEGDPGCPGLKTALLHSTLAQINKVFKPLQRPQIPKGVTRFLVPSYTAGVPQAGEELDFSHTAWFIGATLWLFSRRGLELLLWIMTCLESSANLGLWSWTFWEAPQLVPKNYFDSWNLKSLISLPEYQIGQTFLREALRHQPAP